MIAVHLRKSQAYKFKHSKLEVDRKQISYKRLEVKKWEKRKKQEKKKLKAAAITSRKSARAAAALDLRKNIRDSTLNFSALPWAYCGLMFRWFRETKARA